MKLRHSVLGILIALSLTACGYQLRGSYHIPPALQQLQLRLNTSSNLAMPLRNTLIQSGIDLDEGNYALEIVSEELNKQTTSTDSRAKAAEYTLYYQVEYQLKSIDNKTVLPVKRLLLRRSYQYDTTAIVGKGAEEELLIRELYQDAAHQIVQQLRAFNTDTRAP
ncbi:LPS assembly lipoprotein LptE [Agitococcus lubricus]|uniref:LPS-assembly lipoprotein LptE n=1 Tax=Agitococcus lubricus TaxID=1077255 RepID=A0A2T5J1X9_9GAMM|nr:LPS assembly lipoprotein LptE [Agitococcus lubricus]PTQ90408.1 LPS-assembly lipoprotein [Agitococcus lubricus]